MIALRQLFGKAGTHSCTYENDAKCGDETARLRELVLELEARLAVALAAPSTTEYQLQRALDENSLQQMLIDQLQAQLTAKTTLITTAVQPEDYTVLQLRVSQLEAKLADKEEELARSVEQQARSKAHITALQNQREQLIIELEQVEDGFQAEVEKLSGDLQNWKSDFHIDCETVRDVEAPQRSSAPKASLTQIPTREGRSASVTSSGNILSDSLERTKATTRIWALEDEVDRVRTERDTLRRRLGAGRASLIQLKQQASGVRLGGKSMINVGRGLMSESQPALALGAGTLGRKSDREARRLAGKASSMQLNTLVRPPMRGEPLTPETSDDNVSFDMNV